MIDKSLIEYIDSVIKEIWTTNIQEDYLSDSMLKEDSLKCCFYYHLRTRLSDIMEEYNLRIYPEYYYSPLHYKADLAIVQVNPDSDEDRLKNRVIKVIAIIELKYVYNPTPSTTEWVKKDLSKLKSYIQSGELLCQYYWGVIYEAECKSLKWLDKRSTNHWANGYVTELDAGYINDEIQFEVNSYNHLNSDMELMHS